MSFFLFILILGAFLTYFALLIQLKLEGDALGAHAIDSSFLMTSEYTQDVPDFSNTSSNANRYLYITSKISPTSLHRQFYLSIMMSYISQYVSSYTSNFIFPHPYLRRCICTSRHDSPSSDILTLNSYTTTLDYIENCS